MEPTTKDGASSDRGAAPARGRKDRRADDGALEWLDGFEPDEKDAIGRASPQIAGRAYAAIDALAQRAKVEVVGVENIPKGRALLVANHAFGWDAVFPMAAIAQQSGRKVWALGEHLWWKVPFLRRMASALGVVDGTRANADRLLSADEIVLVLPGGLREAMKPRELRYRLLWGNRYGFVKAAIRNSAPLVPLAAIGPDDLFDLVGDAYARGRRWLGRSFPLPVLQAARPVHLRFVFGDPIRPSAPPELAEDFDALRRLRHEVEGELQELIDVELARRAKIAT
jgi:1-acyl-sn-glycerol-3-phosphate acyltransferase